MSEEIVDPYKAPNLLIAHFANQVAHLDGLELASQWAEETTDSFKLWLTYAKFTHRSVGGGHRVTNFEVTRPTREEEICLEKAPQREIDAYIQWAVPAGYRERWMRGGKNLVPPVHFSFFMHYRRRSPERPLHAYKPNDTFWHPLFSSARSNGSRSVPWVVPQSFFTHFVEFNGRTVPETETYFGFPYLARCLFEWLYDRNRVRGQFSGYYSARYRPWIAEQQPGGRAPATLAPPYEAIHTNWRWSDVLWMLENDAGQDLEGSAPCPKDCVTPSALPANQAVMDYLERFGIIAELWLRSRMAGGA